MHNIPALPESSLVSFSYTYLRYVLINLLQHVIPTSGIMARQTSGLHFVEQNMFKDYTLVRPFQPSIHLQPSNLSLEERAIKGKGCIGKVKLARSLLHLSTLRVLMIVSQSFGELNQNFFAKLLLSTKSFRCDPARLKLKIFQTYYMGVTCFI